VRDGIYFSFANNTEVLNNHIHKVRYGLHYMYSDDNSFKGNVFENNVAGAALMFSKRIEFYQNVFARCRGFRAYGILYQSMDETLARDNLIIDNSRGIFFDNCNFNQFIYNDIVDNDLALQLMGNGEGNSIVKNNFINNLGNLVVDVRESSTIWVEETGGNFWTEYRGFDLNGDGKGDKPYSIQNVFQVLESDIPEIRFYLHSPAAEILEVAERALPILELGSEKDVAPFMKPIHNDEVPWEKTEALKALPSPLWAIMFILIAAMVITLFQRYIKIS
jgi:nitrous oxidase accessory protein